MPNVNSSATATNSHSAEPSSNSVQIAVSEKCNQSECLIFLKSDVCHCSMPCSMISELVNIGTQAVSAKNLGEGQCVG